MFQATKYVPRIAYGRNRRFMSFEFGWFKQYWRLNSRNKLTKSLTKHMYSFTDLLNRRILKLALTFKMFIHFFVFCWIAKKDKLLYNIFYWNHPTFSISWRCPKIHFIATLKNCFDIWHQFQHSTPCPKDMIRT